jgi:hypothetical protein
MFTEIDIKFTAAINQFMVYLSREYPNINKPELERIFQSFFYQCNQYIKSHHKLQIPGIGWIRIHQSPLGDKHALSCEFSPTVELRTWITQHIDEKLLYVRTSITPAKTISKEYEETFQYLNQHHDGKRIPTGDKKKRRTWRRVRKETIGNKISRQLD